MNDVLASTQSLPGAIATLYGPVECTDRRAIHVYTDGSYFKLPDGSERAGAGIYWGYGSPKNCALMVPTPVSNNRAELYAILRAITVADPCRTLHIHTDSTYAIHSICHWAPRNSALGWRKANGDLLRNIVDLIKRRTAAVVFIWVKGHSGNASNEAADELAGWGASMQGPLLPFVPVVAEWGASSCPGINTEGQQGETMYLKVHTALPEQNAPRPEAQAGTASSLVAVHSDDDDRSPEGFNL
ncbi:hypothetical protein EVJ58_g6061 [Rhodofomes roseus]|uniref:ribonuclease H n=1 Tax=Rhodofomes roseus TaxID=34475 RepID=A0A4Y9Y8Y4_9APHY|nr:hypothetical protein EVJ58_g6061 [Rhodofomes roseus]